MTRVATVRTVYFTLTVRWREAIDGWGSYLISGSKPSTTLYLRQYHLRRFADQHGHLDPWEVTVDDLTAWLASYEWAPETRRSYQGSLRSFFHWAHVSGRVSVDPAALLPTIKPPDAQPRPAPEEFFRDALRQATPRIAMMVELAGFAGLRRGEIAQASREDVEPDPGGWVLFVHGKGRRERRVPLLPGFARELRAAQTGYLFPGSIGGHLSAPYVGKLISSVLPDGWSAHSLRHRFSAKFYEHERDIRATQQVLGHASVVTTQRYTPVPAGALWRGMSNVGLDMTA